MNAGIPVTYGPNRISGSGPPPDRINRQEIGCDNARDEKTL
jgi:hypothetical protein